MTRNASQAKEAIVAWDPFSPVPITSGDALALRGSTRIGTTSTGTKCSGPGGSHNNATGLRLYYDATSRTSQFTATISPAASQNLDLHSDGNVCGNTQSTNVTTRTLDGTAPTATAAKCKDSGGVNFAGGNPYAVIGTWSMTVP